MCSSTRHAIENLMYRYAHALDSGRLEDLAALFTHGRILGPDGATVAVGYDGALDLYQRSARLYPPEMSPRTQHIISNIYLEEADDGLHASAESAFSVLQQVDEFPLQVIIAGSYRDRFEKRDKQWWFSERQMLPRLYGDLSHHLLLPMQAGE